MRGAIMKIDRFLTGRRVKALRLGEVMMGKVEHREQILWTEYVSNNT
jgi:hypothetical protein